jgi:Flp pilus assembly protein TadB
VSCTACADSARASAYVVGLAPIAYLAFAGVADHRVLGDLVGNAIGRVCLVVGLTLELLGAWCIRALVREAPWE